MSNWDFTVFTGNPEVDRNTALGYQQQAQAQGLQIDIQPLPTGGYHIRAWAPQQQQQQQQAPQAAWGQPQTPAQPAAWGAQPPAQPQAAHAAWGQPQAPAQGAAWGQQSQAQAAPQSWGGQQQGDYAAQQSAPAFGAGAAPPFASPTGGGAAVMAAGAFGAGAVAGDTALDARRVTYLRKVYGLLTGSALFAIVAGMASITLGPTETFSTTDGIAVEVPIVVALLLGNRFMWGAAFALLFGATIVAGWVSKVKGLNVIALFGVAALMGVELAPMVFTANVMAGLGRTMTATPVRDAFIMVGAVFIGITTYIFLTKKDFSYLRATLSMGFFVIFAASILAMFMGSEAFSLAVATAGSVLAAGFLLYVTSYIFRNSEMDDPVGDALALLVQLRNLFMFILRIFMSSRD